jgi:hypothetical protein
MGWEEDANHKSMLHREEPKLFYDNGRTGYIGFIA